MERKHLSPAFSFSDSVAFFFLYSCIPSRLPFLFVGYSAETVLSDFRIAWLCVVFLRWVCLVYGSLKEPYLHFRQWCISLFPLHLSPRPSITQKFLASLFSSYIPFFFWSFLHIFMTSFFFLPPSWFSPSFALLFVLRFPVNLLHSSFLPLTNIIYLCLSFSCHLFLLSFLPPYSLHS